MYIYLNEMIHFNQHRKDLKKKKTYENSIKSVSIFRIVIVEIIKNFRYDVLNK